MFQTLIRASAPLLLLLSAPLAAQTDAPVTQADLLRHIQVLASDEYQGRRPGTEGETRTTAYIVEQLRSRGLEPAGENGSWFQPVPLIERATLRASVAWTLNGRALPFDLANIALQGREASQRLADAPVIFAGHGARIPERGIDQLAGVNVQGAVVLILFDAPDVADFPSFSDRVRAMTNAGAGAVIALTGPDIPWTLVSNNYQRVGTKLASQVVAPVLGAMPLATGQQLIEGAGGNFSRLLNDQPGSSFRAVTLPIRATIDVDTNVRRYDTQNVLARIRGSGASGESVVLMGHWDHLGTCRPEGAPDRICNGAVDNASGIATMIEVAGRVARGPRPVRDVVILATTAEEMGLLGAEYFAGHPTVPLDSIAVAINFDTVAVHPAGEPVAILGHGLSALDSVINATAQAMGRRVDTEHEADSMLHRQDGWALMRAGVPAVMVGGSFASMARLGAFLSGRYHKPEDQADGQIVLDGAAEDADLQVALVRRLADPAVYQRPRRTAE
jgi:Zn-dependent M28 family amino/carboxypeptidase